ncbi:hypothetical protein RSO01_62490 [Reyranella soli]|uniref:Uncharacterized protein n=1 Tax=Reyranella soli TaxID=1230389 RepID=A0A512NJF8_9HYPH|nr:hypothetical protein RSO01_62490 [Reyranella soli]
MIATKAAVGAADPRKDITMATNDDPDFEPVHDASPTDHVLTELQLFGHRPFEDEPDARPLPEAQTITGAIVDIFDVLVSTLTDTRLEPDLEDLLWSTVNLSIAASNVSNARSTTTSARSIAASASKMVRRSAQSSSSV